MLRRYCSSAVCWERSVMADAVPDGSSLGTPMRLPLESCAWVSCTRPRAACRPRSDDELMSPWVTRTVLISESPNAGVVDEGVEDLVHDGDEPRGRLVRPLVLQEIRHLLVEVDARVGLHRRLGRGHDRVLHLPGVRQALHLDAE